MPRFSRYSLDLKPLSRHPGVKRNFWIHAMYTYTE